MKKSRGVHILIGSAAHLLLRNGGEVLFCSGVQMFVGTHLLHYLRVLRYSLMGKTEFFCDDLPRQSRNPSVYDSQYMRRSHLLVSSQECSAVLEGSCY